MVNITSGSGDTGLMSGASSRNTRILFGFFNSKTQSFEHSIKLKLLNLQKFFHFFFSLQKQFLLLLSLNSKQILKPSSVLHLFQKATVIPKKLSFPTVLSHRKTQKLIRKFIATQFPVRFFFLLQIPLETQNQPPKLISNLRFTQKRNYLHESAKI